MVSPPMTMMTQIGDVVVRNKAYDNLVLLSLKSDNVIAAFS
jgi:hypothetical protein